MASEPIRAQESTRFGERFEFDVSAHGLRRDGHALKLERIPLEILVLLLDHCGEIVTRDEIVENVWGKDAFLDTDNSIRGAVRKIRQALKDDPEVPRFVQTITGQGYRFIAPVIRPEEEKCRELDAGLPSPRPHLELEAERKERRTETSPEGEGDHGPRAARARLWLVLGGVTLLTLIGVTSVITRSRARNETGPAIKSLAVLPLRNLSGDPAQEYLADGMTEALIGHLSMIRGLRVISRTSVTSLKDTKLSAPDIAKTLHVDALVEGSVMRQGGRIRVYAQLIRGATDEHFWSETYDRELPDVLALESDVAQSVARKVEVTVTGEERARLVAAHQVAPEVYESYLKGRFAKSNNRSEIEQRIAYFQDAIAKDPTFAPAYVSIAGAYEELGTSFTGAPTQETRPKVIRMTRKALELDPELAEAHALLGTILKQQFQWADAAAEYKQALALNPNNSAAHLEYAEWLTSHGRVDEALTWSRRARELDPLGDAGISIGWILFAARRYDEAIREFRSTLAVHPDYAGVHLLLAFPMIANGQAEQAIPDLEETASMTNRNPGSLWLLATAHARAGHRAEALRLIDELRQRWRTGDAQAMSFVNPNLALGNYDEAFVWFERAYEKRENILLWIKVHPFFDPVRNDPRFKDLQRRVGLDESSPQ